jgi:hypothetical protein
MVENAADQIGFENAWLEEADELLQGTCPEDEVRLKRCF